MKSKATNSHDYEVLIVFHPRGSQLKALAGKAGDWVVTTRHVVARPGETIKWRTVPRVKLEVYLPEAFTESHVQGNGSVTADLKRNVDLGHFLYEVFCDGQLATGGSSPGVIVDT